MIRACLNHLASQEEAVSKNHLLIIFCLSTISLARAGNPESLPEPTLPEAVLEAPADRTAPETKTSPYFNLHWSPLSTWIPSKFGISGGAAWTSGWSLEAEYTRAGISAGFRGVDLGKVVDHRLGVQARWAAFRSSFNFIFGFYRSEFSAELGNSLYNNLSQAPEVRLWRLESWGPQFGVSNRWTHEKGLQWGVDWFVIYLPLVHVEQDQAFQSVTDPSGRSDLDKVSALVRNLPQFDILKLQVGYRF